MESVQELEKKIAIAKQLEKTEALEKVIGAIKEKYQGKAYGSHTFERKNRSGHCFAEYYEKFWIQDSKILVTKWRIGFTRTGKNYVFSANHLTFDRSKGDLSISDEYGNNAVHHMHDTTRYSKEMSLDKFMGLWEYGKFVVVELDKVMTERIENKIDVLRIGSSSDEKRLEADFKQAGIEYIDIASNLHVFNIVKYKNLPGLQEQRFLPVVLADKVIKLLLVKLHAEKASLRGSNRNYMEKQIEILDSFLEEIKEKYNLKNKAHANKNNQQDNL